jgi:hypothetical protein
LTGGEQAALALLGRMRARAVSCEGIGVLQRWSGCDRAQARAWLSEGPDAAGGHGEAARIVALADAQAREYTDPDAHWD